MTAGPDQPTTPEPTTPEPPAPAPTVIVGYPEAPAAAAAAPQANPGMASLRSSVRTLRYLVLACLGLLLVLLVGLGVALANSRAQLDALSAQVTALGEQASAQAAAAAQPQAQAPEQGQQQEQPVAQLGPAPDLTVGDLPAGVDATGAVLIGDPNASNVVEVYIDYQCPFCQRWEEQFGTAIMDRALQPGSDLLVKQYNLAFLGETNGELSPAGASARAAAAAACVINHDGPETFAAFSRSVFQAADPSEPPGQFTAEALTDLATQAGASEASIACIAAEENVPFVAATTQAGFGRGVGGTPTVIINGRTLGNPFTDPAVSEVAGGA